MITYIPILLGFLCLGILIYSTFLKSTNFRLISKIFCSLCFLLISITAYLNNPVNLTYFYLIFIGLLFSFLGDIFLGIKKSEPKFNYILFMSCSDLKDRFVTCCFSSSFIISENSSDLW